MGKLDYNIGARDTLSATFAAQDSPTTVPFSGSSGATTVNGFPVSTEVAAYFGNIGYTHSFSPATINVARFTAQRNNTKQNYPIGTQPGPVATGDWHHAGPGGRTHHHQSRRQRHVRRIQSLRPGQHRGQHPHLHRRLFLDPRQPPAEGGLPFLFVPRRDDLRLLPERRVRFLRSGHRHRFGQRPGRFPDGPARRFPAVSQRAHQHPVAFLRRIRAGRLENQPPVHPELRLAVRIQPAQVRHPEPLVLVHSGRAIDGVSRRSAGPAVPRRQGRAARLELAGPHQLRPAGGFCLGRLRQRQDQRSRRLRHVLRHSQGRGQPSVQWADAVLRLCVSDIQPARRRVHFRSRHPVRPIRRCRRSPIRSPRNRSTTT